MKQSLIFCLLVNFLVSQSQVYDTVNTYYMKIGDSSSIKHQGEMLYKGNLIQYELHCDLGVAGSHDKNNLEKTNTTMTTYTYEDTLLMNKTTIRYYSSSYAEGRTKRKSTATTHDECRIDPVIYNYSYDTLGRILVEEFIDPDHNSCNSREVEKVAVAWRTEKHFHYKKEKLQQTEVFFMGEDLMKKSNYRYLDDSYMVINKVFIDDFGVKKKNNSSSCTYEEDAFGNIISEKKRWKDGHLSYSKKYTYNSVNKLVRVEVDDKSISANDFTKEFEYDDLGRLSSIKTIYSGNSSLEGREDSILKFVYSSNFVPNSLSFLGK